MTGNGSWAGWHSHNGERRKKYFWSYSLARNEGRSQMVGWGKDSFLQLCNRALRESIQLFECALSWVPAGMWTVNLFHHPSRWPANNPCSSQLLPYHLFFSLSVSTKLFPHSYLFSLYLSVVHLILLSNVSIWLHFPLAMRCRIE